MKDTALCHHETADNYQAVVAVLNDRHRVIVCKEGIQWILQRREKSPAERPWRGLHYCQTRKALIRLSGAFSPAVDPIAMKTLVELPEHIGMKP
jgi:hypothetical protein